MSLVQKFFRLFRKSTQTQPYNSTYIQFVKSAHKSTNKVVTKFGGQPTWVHDIQWPLSKTTGNPMRFICQILLDKKLFLSPEEKIAYIFMTDEEEHVDSTWEANGGENAVVIQSHSTKYIMKNIKNVADGPTIEAEYGIKVSYVEESETDPGDGNKIGGTPSFIQGDEFPEGGEWQLLLQLDSSIVPFYINFGDSGVAYIFINKDCSEGKFLWQCL